MESQIIKAVRLAVKDIDNDLIEIYPKDTATKANQTLKSAFELSEMGIKIVIGPVFLWKFNLFRWNERFNFFIINK